MEKESMKFDKKEPSRGDIELDKGDRAKAYYYYVRDNDIEGLHKLSKILLDKGKPDKARSVLLKASELYESENK